MSLDNRLLCAELSSVRNVATELHVEIRAECLLTRAQTRLVGHLFGEDGLVGHDRTRRHLPDRVQAIARVTRQHAHVEHLLRSDDHILVTVFAPFESHRSAELRIGVLALANRRRSHGRVSQVHHVLSVKVHVARYDSVYGEVDHGRRR